MAYDYEKGKQRIESILSSRTKIEKVNSIPTSDGAWTYDNGILSWVSAIFVDLRDSKPFFAKGDKLDVARTIRAYISEVIEIMSQSNLMREIGVRGDCVYGVFSTPNPQCINEVFHLTIWINTFMSILNQALSDKGLRNVKAGIGMSCSEDLIIKAGRKGKGVNDRVWIGTALAEANRLSKVTSKSGFYESTFQPIAVCGTVYHNINKYGNNVELLKKHPGQDYYSSSAYVQIE